LFFGEFDAGGVEAVELREEPEKGAAHGGDKDAAGLPAGCRR